MSKTRRPSPGAARHPNHRITIVENHGQFVAAINRITVAESSATLALDETGYERVIYFPRLDVRESLLQESDTRTNCPFKGEARYFAAEIDGEAKDVAWFYPAVYEEVAPIENYIAFYGNRVELSATTDTTK